MTEITDHKDYREYLKRYIEKLPKAGRGFSAKLAKAISVSPVIISQVLNGTRSFSMEQAFAVTKELGLSPLETDYFIHMVNLDRAGNWELKEFYEDKLKALSMQLGQVKSRLKNKKELDDKAKAFYYANWYLTAIRLLINNPKYNSPGSIASELDLSLDKVNSALAFLEEYDLIAKTENGFEWKGTSTHIPSDSPLVNRHHQNWRTRATVTMESERKQETEVFYTAPMIIDKDTAKKLRKKILHFLSENAELITSAPSEDLFCLNLDLFQVTDHKK